MNESGALPLSAPAVLVTGASSGFGFEIARRVSREGSPVVGIARTKSAIEACMSSIRSEGGLATAIACDVSDEHQVRHAFGRIESAHDGLAAVINCAGIPGPYGPVGSVSPSDWWRTQEVHVRGALNTMSHALPAMVRRRGGRIINIVSPAGVGVYPGLSAYSVAKAALIRLTEHVAAESRAHGIVAFAVDPGMANTRLTEDTLTSADAAQWVPDFVSFVKRTAAARDPAADFAACAQRCIDLLSGRFDALSGEYLAIEDELAGRCVPIAASVEQ